ncbi:MAG: bifunctional rhamnulose-1-phosphate aldolase/short-chain dehydrogenase [Verrucomicrobiales bacterium]
MFKYQHVNDLWDDAYAATLDPVEQLVYRSNLLGRDLRITNTGGGNTSSKLLEKDPLTEKATEVLWVKGSGGDLRTSTRANFSSLYQEKLLGLQATYGKAEPRGAKTPIEDAMVGMYPHCTFNLNPRASSIDTPLHAFVPFAHVDHMHPNAFIAISAARRSEELTREIYGDEIIFTPWQRPGFELGLLLQDICRDHPNAMGVNLGQHGLINWADDCKSCYDLTLALIEKAAQYIEIHDKGDATFGGEKYGSLHPDKARQLTCELLPWLRGQVSQESRFIATVQADPSILRFVNSYDAQRLAAMGTSCPDHFLRTKIKPLFVDWDPGEGSLEKLRASLSEGLENYRRDYHSYYERCRRDESPAMRAPNPTVILIPGLGMIAWGKNKSESRVTAEFYNGAVEVMRGAEAIDEYVALPEQEAFDIEYWALEEAKLRRMPPEREFERKVVIVVGAGSGIGRETAERMAAEGAHVVCADVSEFAAKEAADGIEERTGAGIGVAGSGLSACGNAIGLACDVTDRTSIRAMLDHVGYAFGGIDHIAVTAGIFVPPDTSGHIADVQWAATFAINVTGLYLVGDEAGKIWRAQQLGSCSLVATTSANAVVAKKGSVAYDASKAAANHVVRELAVELAPFVRVNAVAPATVVAGSAMFPRDRVIASLTKYAIEFSPEDSTEQLRDRLAAFYAERTLTKSPITPADQAEGILFLLSERSSKTTGQVLAVDGGLVDAFLR